MGKQISKHWPRCGRARQSWRGWTCCTTTRRQWATTTSTPRVRLLDFTVLPITRRAWELLHWIIFSGGGSLCSPRVSPFTRCTHATPGHAGGFPGFKTKAQQFCPSTKVMVSAFGSSSDCTNICTKVLWETNRHIHRHINQPTNLPTNQYTHSLCQRPRAPASSSYLLTTFSLWDQASRYVCVCVCVCVYACVCMRVCVCVRV